MSACCATVRCVAAPIDRRATEKSAASTEQVTFEESQSEMRTFLRLVTGDPDYIIDSIMLR
jgi:hypothetical protein